MGSVVKFCDVGDERSGYLQQGDIREDLNYDFVTVCVSSGLYLCKGLLATYQTARCNCLQDVKALLKVLLSIAHSSFSVMFNSSTPKYLKIYS
jgi:hypothetical protein